VLRSIFCKKLSRLRIVPLAWILSGPVTAGFAAEGQDAGPGPLPVPVPATPTVLLEVGWLVQVEGSETLRLVTGEPPQVSAETLFSLRFRYEGDTPAEGLRIVQAVPEGMHYRTGTATGPGAEVRFSVDGGMTFGPAESLTVVTVAAGAAETPRRPAVAADYSHIRWDLPGLHPPGISGLVSFRARPAGLAAKLAGTVESPGL
jgi:hypothetical protein